MQFSSKLHHDRAQPPTAHAGDGVGYTRDRTSNKPPLAAASRTVMPGTISGVNSSSTARQQHAAVSSWKLPRRHTANPNMTHSEIVHEFKKLDIIGEGRLNFLNLKTALELRDVQEDDTHINNWIRENDLGGKGYVDVSDYERIFRGPGSIAMSATTGSALNLNSRGVGQQRSSDRGNGGKGATMTAAATTAAATGAPRRSPSPSLATTMSRRESRPTGGGAHNEKVLHQDRLQLLRTAFEKYDINKDGLISVDDLRQVFASTGKDYSEAELQTWVRKRDKSGTGDAVNFDDFCRHYG